MELSLYLPCSVLSSSASAASDGRTTQPLGTTLTSSEARPVGLVISSRKSSHSGRPAWGLRFRQWDTPKAGRRVAMSPVSSSTRTRGSGCTAWIRLGLFHSRPPGQATSSTPGRPSPVPVLEARLTAGAQYRLTFHPSQPKRRFCAVSAPLRTGREARFHPDRVQRRGSTPHRRPARASHPPKRK